MPRGSLFSHTLIKPFIRKPIHDPDDAYVGPGPSCAGARFAVALDFGTTFSGFAYARTDRPKDVQLYYDYPEALVQYCKTISAAHYLKSNDGKFKLNEWGWPACKSYQHRVHEFNTKYQAAKSDYDRALLKEQKDCMVGVLLSKFKLFLAPKGEWQLEVGHRRQAYKLPLGLTVDGLISDYLQHLGRFALDQLKNNYGNQVTMADVQWAITVPAIWDDEARQRMRILAMKAGLVRPPLGQGPDNGGSPHKVHIVLEPEAASVCCFAKEAVQLADGESILIVDAGGGTVDLATHKKVGGKTGMKFCEVTRSTGDLCGGAFVDEAFEAYLKKRIPCAKDVLDPLTLGLLLRNWDSVKCQFRGSEDYALLQLPAKLASAWEKEDGPGSSKSHYEIQISGDEMRGIYNPAVDKVIDLVRHQVNTFEGSFKALLVVGGFSGSPYLRERIREEFGRVVPTIVNPPNPGAAVCEGAVHHMLQRDFMVSRFSRKTYCIATLSSFREGVDPKEKLVIREEDGARLCADRATIFVRNGDSVDCNAVVMHELHPHRANDKVVTVRVHSTLDREPKYATDEGMVREAAFTVSIPDTKGGRARVIKTSMHFGLSTIEVHAKVTNFKKEEDFIASIELETD